MRALALASLLTPILLVSACTATDPTSASEPEVCVDGQLVGVDQEMTFRTTQPEHGSAPDLDDCRAAENRVCAALVSGDRAGAASEVRTAIDALMAEGRMNSADPRIDVLDRLSGLADQVGEKDLANQAWERVCVLRLSIYSPQIDQERLLALDQAYASNHQPRLVVVIPPSPPAPESVLPKPSAEKAESADAPLEKAAVEAAAIPNDREAERARLLALMASGASDDDAGLVDEFTLLYDRDREAGDTEAALASLAAAKTVSDRHAGDDAPALQAARVKLVDKLRAENLLISAAEVMQQAVDSLERTKPAESKELADARQLLDEILAESNQQAEKQAELAQRVKEATQDPADGASPARDELRDLVAKRSKELGFVKQGEDADRLASEMENALLLLPKDELGAVESREALGAYYQRNKHYERALELRREVADTREQRFSADTKRLRVAWDNVMTTVKSIAPDDVEQAASIQRKIDAIGSEK